ncbi:MAG: hypothetical protein K2X41_04305 [Hyphomicrobium sp.]|nr:hypothetical protein [Hyphomicrobium sp.]
MRKRSQSNVVVTIEWNAEDGRIENLPEEDLLALARALGRLAARRDLAQLQRDRAMSQPRSKDDTQPDDAELPKSRI